MRNRAWIINICGIHRLYFPLANLWKHKCGNIGVTLCIEIWLPLVRNSISELGYMGKNVFLGRNFNYEKCLL